jgi:hypothetical protein
LTAKLQHLLTFRPGRSLAGTLRARAAWLAVCLAPALVAYALVPAPTRASAYSYESGVLYLRDYNSQKAYRSTKVTHGGWANSWNAWAFNTWTVEGYANIMLTTYRYHYAVHTRNTSSWPEERRYIAWDLNYNNTPSYVPQE